MEGMEEIIEIPRIPTPDTPFASPQNTSQRSSVPMNCPITSFLQLRESALSWRFLFELSSTWTLGFLRQSQHILTGPIKPSMFPRKRGSSFGSKCGTNSTGHDECLALLQGTKLARQGNWDGSIVETAFQGYLLQNFGSNRWPLVYLYRYPRSLRILPWTKLGVHQGARPCDTTNQHPIFCGMGQSTFRHLSLATDANLDEMELFYLRWLHKNIRSDRHCELILLHLWSAYGTIFQDKSLLYATLCYALHRHRGLPLSRLLDDEINCHFLSRLATSLSDAITAKAVSECHLFATFLVRQCCSVDSSEYRTHENGFAAILEFLLEDKDNLHCTPQPANFSTAMQ